MICPARIEKFSFYNFTPFQMASIFTNKTRINHCLLKKQQKKKMWSKGLGVKQLGDKSDFSKYITDDIK